MTQQTAAHSLDFTATEEATSVFTVVVTIKDLVYSVIEAEGKAAQAQSNALHRFLQYSSTADNVVDSLSVIAGDTENKTVKSRCSELKAVYQACKHGLELSEGIGYHDAVKRAREILKEKGILPNGKARKTEEEKAKDHKNKSIMKMMQDGIDVQEAVEKYEEMQHEEQQMKDLIDDEALAICTANGHKIARAIAKRILELTKDDLPAKPATM